MTRWTVVASFFTGQGDRWLDDFLPDDGRTFRKQAPPEEAGNWHFKRSARTSVGAWAQHLRQARAALADRPDGVIACFPQLAMCVALLKRLGWAKPHLIAYNYNLGGFPGGVKQRLARFVARQIDAYVVHAPSEVESYAAYLDVPPERVRFIPLQRGEIGVARVEEAESPFVLAMGSAHRDYATLIAAVDALGVPTVIVTRASEAEALPSSPHVTLRSGLSAEACMALLARARLSVTPISNRTTASGQITFLNAMQLGVPVIATDCPGTEGYIEDGHTGLLVPPFDPEALKVAIMGLWQDASRRAALSDAARQQATTRFSDQAAAAALSDLIASVEAGPDRR